MKRSNIKIHELDITLPLLTPNPPPPHKRKNNFVSIEFDQFLSGVRSQLSKYVRK